MLNKLWGFMILIGLSFGIIKGEVEALSNALLTVQERLFRLQ